MICHWKGLWLLASLAVAATLDHQALPDAQQVLEIAPERQGNPRKLQGRFLHMTDFHPDPFYKIRSDPDGEHPCHKGKGDSATGYYGAATTGCDSPFALINATFKWIEANIKDEIDFVVWTGDSARHDNDLDLPRSTKQIEDLNRYLVSKVVETFGKPDNINDTDPTNDFVVPIVPTYGNNDILPHNIFAPGPNRWTKKYLDIWASFVPEEQRHSFARGGWFFTEVIPNRLAVISLNTLYFFSSNNVVDGCDLESEPGYEHMEWLRIQLQFMRERKMKAILIGHVPPARTESKQSWDETCYQKYTLWQRQYRDVIVANIFGHMNIDHFMFQDVRDLTYKFKIDGIDDEGLRPKDYNPDPIPNDQFHAMAKASYINELRDAWAKLPEPPKGCSNMEDVESPWSKKQKCNLKEYKKFLKAIGGEWAERFTISLVSPSVVPNYFPTLRIIEYNITGLEHDHPATGRPQGTPASEMDVVTDGSEADHAGLLHPSDQETEPESDIDTEKKHKKRKKKKPKKPSFPVPIPPSKSSLPGPAFSPQPFSFISWTQLYANLTKIHQKMSSKSEDISGSPDSEMTASDMDINSYSEPQWLLDARERAANNKDGKSTHDEHFDFRVEYTSDGDGILQTRDLTMRSWLEVAERIGRTEFKKSDSIDEEEGTESLTSYSLNSTPDETRSDSRRQEDEVDTEKKKKHKDSGTGRLKKNRLWHSFVKRVFVQTMSEKDLEDDFD